MHRLCALVVAAGLLAACGTGPQPDARGAAGQPGTDGGEAPGQGLTVVATVFPLAWLVAEMAPGADVVFLGARGQDPHDLELSPGDRQAIESADVVLYVGDLDFQPQVEAAVGSARGTVVSAAAVAGDARLLALADDAGADDHDHDDGHDPHLWFDAGLMADVTEATGAALATADPAAAADYGRNAAELAEALRAIENEVDERLADCRLGTAIVSHEAYAYILEPRGLRQEGISGAGGHAEASPQRLAELTARIRAEAVPAVAAEPVEGRRDAETLVAEAGIDLVEIHPLETATDDEFAVGYPEMLRQQAEALATALACG